MESPSPVGNNSTIFYMANESSAWPYHDKTKPHDPCLHSLCPSSSPCSKRIIPPLPLHIFSMKRPMRRISPSKTGLGILTRIFAAFAIFISVLRSIWTGGIHGRTTHPRDRRKKSIGSLRPGSMGLAFQRVPAARDLLDPHRLAHILVLYGSLATTLRLPDEHPVVDLPGHGGPGAGHYPADGQLPVHQGLAGQPRQKLTIRIASPHRSASADTPPSRYASISGGSTTTYPDGRGSPIPDNAHTPGSVRPPAMQRRPYTPASW